jgi:CheY-like chemotaxis protein
MYRNNFCSLSAFYKPAQHMSSLKGPILLIDNDAEDRQLFTTAFSELKVPNPIIEFTDGQPLINYLHTTTAQPFLILSDIKLDTMSGLELRARINQDPILRAKGIPFVFITDYPSEDNVKQAYLLTVQGFFQKAPSMEQLKEDLDITIKYCLHPNRDFKY